MYSVPSITKFLNGASGVIVQNAQLTLEALENENEFALQENIMVVSALKDFSKILQ